MTGTAKTQLAAADGIDLEMRQRKIYQRLIDLHFQTGLEHLGSALSCFEIVSLLYLNYFTNLNRIILSKGHAVSLQYSCLAELGIISEEVFARALRPGGLPSHPPSREILPSLVYGSGSLGHGVCVATGIALAKKMRNESGRVFAVLSDGECNEGTVWETALFAAQHKLTSLSLIIDKNGWQGIGPSNEILNLGDLAKKFEEFGFDVQTVENGHDTSALKKVLAQSPGNRPRAIIAKTVKAKGLDRYLNRTESHYFKLSVEDYKLLSVRFGTGGSL